MRGTSRSAPAAKADALVVGLALIVALVGGFLPRGSTPASALTVEPEQTWETGVVQRVSDGDTVQVTILTATNPEMFAPATGQTYCDNRISASGRIPAEGLTGCSVRLIAVQAPETAGHGVGPAAQCGASQAEKGLAKALPVGTPIQLRSINVASGDPKYSGGRMVRSIYAPDGAGGWVDVARGLYRAGLVMWFPFNVGDTEKAEYAHNLEYRRLADEAAAAGRGLWSGNLCGQSAPASLRMWVVSDPAGKDSANGETVIIFNDADAPADLSGWTLRDSSLKFLRLPAGTAVPAHDYLQISTGPGTNGVPSSRDLYWGRTDNVFANYDPESGYFHGDAAYLYDVQDGYDYGNLRAWYHYPCDPDSCWDPQVGRVTIGHVRADPAGTDTAAREYVEVRNSASAPAALGGYRLLWPAGAYEFPPALVLPARTTLRLVIGAGSDRKYTLHAGSSTSLPNDGGAILLRNVNSAIVDCRRYGNGRCPTGAPQSASPDLAAKRTATTVRYPGPPLTVAGALDGAQVVVSWQPPEWFGRTPVERYQASVYKRVKGKYVRVGKCRAFGSATTCRTGPVKLGHGLFVRVKARNASGYGRASSYVAVPQVTAASW